VTTNRLVSLLVGLSLANVSVSAQSKPWIIVSDSSEQRAASQPRAAKPSTTQPDTMVFFKRHDVHDAKGRVVTGLGFISWTEGQGVHVAVYTMVPKPGAPNTFLAGTSEQLASLQAEALVDFSLKLGEVRSLSELKTLGVEPMAVTLAKDLRLDSGASAH
jgi:hypothetical protein